MKFPAHTSHEQPGLLRALGPGMSTAIVVGGVIGSGIFAKPGIIAAAAGDFRIIISAWVVGGVLSMLGALCFAELATMLPHAGGIYVYLREAFGKPIGFLFGFNEFLFGRPASIGALAMFFVTPLLKFFPQNSQVWAQAFLAVVMIAALAWVNIRGVLWAGHVQGWTTLIKSLFLGGLALTPFVLSALGFDSGLSLAHYNSRVEPLYSDFFHQFAAVLLAVMWAYNGWHDVAPVAEEIKEPQKNIPLAFILGVGIVIALYVAANLAYHGVLTMAEIRDAKNSTPQFAIARMFRTFGSEAAHVGTLMIDAVIMCSAFGALNANLLLGPRISFAMGRDKTFINRLGNVHKDYRTPSDSILVQAGLSAILVILAAGIIEFVPVFKHKNPFDLLTDTVVYSASVFYMLGVIAVFVLRVRHPDWDRPYRTWGYPAVPALFLLGYTLFMALAVQAQPFEGLTGLILAIAGFPVYYAWQALAPKA
ncbi:MAG: amino acid permease [Planctomycetales bacterium]